MTERTATTRLLGRSLAAYDGQPCPYCGTTMAYRPLNSAVAPSRDHFMPTARGGADALDNIVVCCRGCNDLKGDLLATEWLDLLEQDCDPRAPRLALILERLPDLRLRCEMAAARELDLALEMAS